MIQTIYQLHADLLQSLPASEGKFFPFRGGWLEHVLSLCALAKVTAKHYAGIDEDLLLTGVILHDIGKIHELGYERSFLYTTEGQLLGHIIIALRMVDEKIRLIPDFPPRLRTLVDHLIVSHHGSYEFGSPKLPMTPEAIALHHIDNMDAKVHEFSRDIADDPNQQSSWTPYNARLERKLFKGLR